MHSKLAAIALLATTAVAQVPDGHFVVSTLYYNTSPGGLWVLDPRIPETPRPVQNLPRALTNLPTIYSHGANCVKVLPDGRLVVGEMEHRIGQPAELFVLTLSGLTVADYEKISIGTLTNGPAFISEILLLPGGDLLVSGLSDAGIVFRVSLKKRKVTPLTISGLPFTPFASAIALDVTGTAFYMTDVFAPYHVRKVGVNGGAARLVGTAGQHGLMATDHTGQIYIPIVASESTIDRMDPVTGIVTTVGVSGGTANGLQIEPATGKIVFMTNGYGGGPAGQVRIMDPVSGRYTDLSASRSGTASGVAIAPNPATYGEGTPGSASYTWQTATNPGGLPRIGNAQFGARVVSSSADSTGALLAATAPGHLPILGMMLLLDAGTTTFLGSIPASGDIRLPIPSLPSLVGQKLFLAERPPRRRSAAGACGNSRVAHQPASLSRPMLHRATTTPPPPRVCQRRLVGTARAWSPVYNEVDRCVRPRPARICSKSCASPTTKRSGRSTSTGTARFSSALPAVSASLTRTPRTSPKKRC